MGVRGLFVAGVAELTFALSWRVRSAKKAQPLRAPVSLDEPSWPGPLPAAAGDLRAQRPGRGLQQLKTLASLRDSGALTEAEFEAEKRRILGG